MNKYKQRTVEEVKGFCGWEFLLSLIKAFNFPPYQGLVAALFETGGRISEVLKLRRSHFNFEAHPDVIVVEGMPVLKRYEVVDKVSDPSRKRGFKLVTSRLQDVRYFPIKKSEPLVPYLVSWIKKCDDELFTFDRFQALEMIRSAGRKINRPIPATRHRYENRPLHSSEIFLHLFRAERACQLVSEYSFDSFALRQFFGWKTRKEDMAERYASLDWKGLARRMGVKL